jgi:hypothetical protein
MAFQGHQYGGYTQVAVQSYDVADHVVSQSCLEHHPGVDCLLQLINQLEQPQSTGRSGGDGGGTGPTAPSTAPVSRDAKVRRRRWFLSRRPAGSDRSRLS